MDLPFRIQTQAGDQRVISVDGAFGAPGLNLSHWPGHSTPPDLRRDLSTEIAFAFLELPAARQAELTANCEALVNNHFDTDGVCAAFALLQPDLARDHAQALIDAAAAGDCFRAPTDAAVCLDITIQSFADLTRSPIATELAGLESAARYERATLELFDRLGAMLQPGGLEPYEHLWSAPLARLHTDQEDLRKAAFDELVHLDAGVYQASAPFDPGRHAVFSASDLDRVLLLGQDAAGCTARLLINTTSWFDLPTRRAQARPDLASLCSEMNELEGVPPHTERGSEDLPRWRHQPANSPAPEFWFGSSNVPLYVEHGSDHLAKSRLDATTIKARVLDALRATWTFSDDEDEEEGDWRIV